MFRLIEFINPIPTNKSRIELLSINGDDLKVYLEGANNLNCIIGSPGTNLVFEISVTPSFIYTKKISFSIYNATQDLIEIQYPYDNIPIIANEVAFGSSQLTHVSLELSDVKFTRLPITINIKVKANPEEPFLAVIAEGKFAPTQTRKLSLIKSIQIVGLYFLLFSILIWIAFEIRSIWSLSNNLGFVQYFSVVIGGILLLLGIPTPKPVNFFYPVARFVDYLRRKSDLNLVKPTIILLTGVIYLCSLLLINHVYYSKIRVEINCFSLQKAYTKNIETYLNSSNQDIKNLSYAWSILPNRPEAPHLLNQYLSNRRSTATDLANSLEFFFKVPETQGVIKKLNNGNFEPSECQNKGFGLDPYVFYAASIVPMFNTTFFDDNKKFNATKYSEVLLRFSDFLENKRPDSEEAILLAQIYRLSAADTNNQENKSKKIRVEITKLIDSPDRKIDYSHFYQEALDTLGTSYSLRIGANRTCDPDKAIAYYSRLIQIRKRTAQTAFWYRLPNKLTLYRLWVTMDKSINYDPTKTEDLERLLKHCNKAYIELQKLINTAKKFDWEIGTVLAKNTKEHILGSLRKGWKFKSITLIH